MAEAPQTPGRKGDGILLIVQDNAARALTIAGGNDTAAELLGYPADALKDRALGDILGGKSAEMLAEELEFTADAPDFGDLFTRRADIRLRHRAGKEFVQPCSVLRVVTPDRTARFQLILPNQREKLAKQQLRDFLALNLEGRKQLDAATGLPDRQTIEGFIGLLQHYLGENGMDACAAVIRLDRFEKSLARYGKQGCAQLLQHVASICRSTFRTEDVISALSDRTLGVILFDISRESARLVLNRLRWNVGNHLINFGGKSNFSVTISVAFDMLAAARGEAPLAGCEKAATAIDEDARNSLVEVGQ